MPFTSNLTALSVKKTYKPFLLALSGIILFYPAAGSCAWKVSSFPFNEHFETDDYNNPGDPTDTVNMVWTEHGARHEWVRNGGWKGTGGAKFYLPESGGYCGLGSFVEFKNGHGTEQLNARFLIYHGPNFYNISSQKKQKLIIFNRGYENNNMRPMIAGYGTDNDSQGNHFRTYGACDNTLCRFARYYTNPALGSWPDANEPLKIGPTTRSEEWISIELEANIMTGIIKLYVDTQDGELRGLYREIPFQVSAIGGTPFHYIDVIGGYFNSGTPHDPQNYYIIDELEINDHYIGPPDGFVGNAVPNKLSVDINGQSVSREILSYGGSNQDISGTANTEDNGMALSLSGNVWKKVDLGHVVVGPNTMLEFDFSSSSQGEIHGIGFDNGNGFNSNRTFKLYGTQTQYRGISSAGNYSGSGQQHFVIPVGRYYSGPMQWLTFANDQDVTNPSAKSRFSNIRVYEAGN